MFTVLARPEILKMALVLVQENVGRFYAMEENGIFLVALCHTCREISDSAVITV